ncbi:MAG: sulfonate ABC transporter substrate-binding protein [Acidimicrobiia bacterium]
MRFPRTFLLLFVALVTTLSVAACGGDGGKAVAGAKGTTAARDTAAGGSAEPVTLRLGYFANVTHAPAIVGIQKGLFEKALGSRVRLETSVFNAGPAAVEAIFSNAIDASFLGPNPSINAYARSKGEAIRIVAGTASGGAFLVVKPGIRSAADLKGRTLATPQLGNTQDVALRWWLKQQGYKTDTAGGGDVKILPQENSQTLDTFKAGKIDGAWVPEPWATRLVEEGGGDERDLWPGRRFVTTDLVVTTKFLHAHPDIVERLIEGLADSIDHLANNPDEAAKDVAAGIEKASGKAIPVELVTKSFKSITFTLDPIAASLKTAAEHARALGLLDAVDLDGIYDLRILNKVLVARGQKQVTAS